MKGFVSIDAMFMCDRGLGLLHPGVLHQRVLRIGVLYGVVLRAGDLHLGVLL